MARRPRGLPRDDRCGLSELFHAPRAEHELGVGSVLNIHESQFRYVLDAIRTLRGARGAYLDLRAEVQREFNAELQERLVDSVWTAGCSNWYRTESGKVVNNWPGLTSEYGLRTTPASRRQGHLC